METAAVLLARSFVALAQYARNAYMGMASLPALHMFKLNRWMDLGKT
jgi:hypothetical protein